jgi:TolB-like protein/DNA-binding winged helix-turn-helix (wHTH) protein/tetratricopeptide (TPR) repeat protein
VNELPPSRALIRFGVFELDTETGELFKQGSKVRLQDQPFHVLRILLEHNGKLVTRDELQRRIWSADTFVDFDRGLYNAIKKLREALGDDAERPRFIETLSKRGYRFIGSVQNSATADALSDVTPSRMNVETRVPETQKIKFASGLLWGAATLACMAFVLGLNPSGMRDRLFGKSKVPEIQSLAVLPLANLSGDPAQEYFSDGMTDALITNLAQIGSLKVISRTSSMQYKQTKKALSEIARELNVDGIIEGTVQRSGDRVRITAQLIHGPSDKHLWANSYERDTKDVFALEGEVTNDIAGEISASLARGPGPRSAALHSLNVEAYDDYLKGRNYVRRLTHNDIIRGVEFLERSIQRDSKYAPAYADISLAYQELAAAQFSPPAEVLPKAKAAAMNALALDENLAEAHTVLGLVSGEYEWDWAAEERELSRAVQLDPNSSFARSAYAIHLATAGRKKEAMQEINTALELDPFSPMQHATASFVYLWIREYDFALREGRRAVEVDPTFAGGHLALASALGAKGAFGEDFVEWLRYLSLGDDPELAQQLASAAKKLSGPGDQGQKLGHITLSYYQKKSKKHYVAALTIALAYIDLGDKDRTLEWLNKAYQERSNGLYGVVISPSLDPLHSDPRFQNLLRRMDLPH